MAIYDADGTQLTECFDANGDSLEYAYDLNGNVIFEGSEAPTDPYLKNRILVFEDNFNGNSLDTSKWDYEIGYCRNNESQHYRPENAIVSDGVLNLKAIREHYAGDITRNSTWTSASIHTSNRFEAFYGRWQAKIKFPKLVGSFGALWLLGEGLEFGYNDDGTRNYRLGPVTWSNTEGVRCGEIDIVETIPGNNDKARSNLWKYTSATSAGIGSSSAIDLSEWHIYEMEWTETYMQMMVDGVAYKTYDLSSSDLQQYRMPSPTVQNGFYMILNQAVGASGGTPSSETNEMDMLIDWVRVYAPVGYTQSQINAESISIDSSLTLAVGDEAELAVTWNPTLTFDRTTRWSSSNESVVTAHSGLIKAISAGNAVITVTTNNGKTATCLVRVGN